MAVISQFELYNQPLYDDPNSADMMAPMMTAITEGQDVAEHVKIQIVGQLGRQDIHKFQNTITAGEVPTIDFPVASMNLQLNISGDIGYSRVGQLRIIDWVNIWMQENLGYLAHGILTEDDKETKVVGILETELYFIPIITYNVYGKEVYTVTGPSDVKVPKPIPLGIYRVNYTFTTVESNDDDEQYNGS